LLSGFLFVASVARMGNGNWFSLTLAQMLRPYDHGLLAGTLTPREWPHLLVTGLLVTLWCAPLGRIT
jgi:hypothetical protein